MPARMRAVVVDEPGGPEHLRIAERERPLPGPDELLVRVRATALNRADVMQREGRYSPPEGTTDILGLEMAGTVEAQGSACVGWNQGDRVCALLPGGGYAEYVTVPQEMAMPIPPSLSFEAAAAIPEVFLTAFQTLHWHTDVGTAQRVLIHAGASGVGTAAIQIARQAGAEVYVTASTWAQRQRSTTAARTLQNASMSSQTARASTSSSISSEPHTLSKTLGPFH